MLSEQILVVDDDRLILHTLSDGLRNVGYRVIAVESGEEAIDAAKQHAIDLAIIDARMPGMSGVELACKFRDEIGVPFVFLSAYDDRDIVAGAVAAGALGYLVKPLVVTQILPTLKAALVRAKELAALRRTEAQLNAAVTQSRTVSLATGLLMERHQIEQKRAFEDLRKAARGQRRKLEELANDVVAGKADVRTPDS